MALSRKLAYLQQATLFQWAPPDLVRRYQEHKLGQLLRACERRIPFYRESFRHAGVTAQDFRHLADLAHFPLITREELVAAYPDGILSRKPRRGDVVFRTSGTSGLFMEIAYSADANDWLDAIYARALFATGYRPWHRIAYFWWDAEPKPVRPYERLGLMKKTLIPVDPDPHVQLARLRELDPHYIYHFPSSAMMLARLVESEGLGKLRPRGVICHGEFMPREIADAIGRAFRCPVWNQYGAQELNRLGWDCGEHGPLHQDADSAVLEVLDGDRVLPMGEEGDLVFTGLHNDLMPLVRYRIGDVGRAVPGRCACGRGLPRFEVTEGRRDDVLTFADGRQVGPRVLAPRIEDVEGFTLYRVIQTEPNHVDVIFVPEPSGPDTTADTIERVVRGILGPAVSVRARAVENIELSKRGKLRKVVSEVNGPRAGATP